jgi:hypothetical protein
MTTAASSSELSVQLRFKMVKIGIGATDELPRARHTAACGPAGMFRVVYRASDTAVCLGIPSSVCTEYRPSLSARYSSVRSTDNTRSQYRAVYRAYRAVPQYRAIPSIPTELEHAHTEYREKALGTQPYVLYLHKLLLCRGCIAFLNSLL